MITVAEKEYLQDLAKKYKALSETEINQKRRQMWYDINDLKEDAKPVFINHYWPLAMEEILPADSYFCKDEQAIYYEKQLKTKIFYFEDLQDDNVIEPVIYARQFFTVNDYGGMERQIKHADHDTDHSGAYEMVPVLNEFSDIEKVGLPEIDYDIETSKAVYEEAKEIFEPILTVLKHPHTFAAKIPDEYSWLRGMENTYLDMYDNPEWMHEVLAKIRDNFKARFEIFEELGIWGCLDKSEPLGSAGLRYVTGIPDYRDVENPFDYKVKVSDSWGFTCAEVYHCVSNDMHDEFGVSYDKEVMDKFKFINVGCCEVLDKKIALCRMLPNARKISVSEWCDHERAASEIKKDYVYSYRAAGTHFVPDEWDKESAEKEIRSVLESSKRHNCNTEIVLNIGGTLGANPRQKVIEWSKMVRDLREEYYGY